MHLSEDEIKAVNQLLAYTFGMGDRPNRNELLLLGKLRTRIALYLANQPPGR